MYAIIRTGGKQYKVQPGDVIRVEKLTQDLGTEFELTDIILVGGDSPVVNQLGLKEAKVTVVVTKQTRDRKVIIFKKKRRQGYRRLKSHRQPFTELFVKSISVNGETATTEEVPKVVDVDQKHLDRIQAKIDLKQSKRKNGGVRSFEKSLESKEKIETTIEEKETLSATKKKATKKVAKKTSKATKTQAKAKAKTKKVTAKKKKASKAVATKKSK